MDDAGVFPGIIARLREEVKKYLLVLHGLSEAIVYELRMTGLACGPEEKGQNIHSVLKTEQGPSNTNILLRIVKRQKGTF